MKKILHELRRRSVFKVSISYFVVGWIIIEVSSTILPTFESPVWILKALTLLIILGFPLAVILAWAFEVTPEGIKRDRPVESTNRERPDTLAAEKAGNDDLQIHVARIAVLPLDTMSANDEDEYMADGLTEDLITLLSRTPGMFVIARNSCYLYKKKVISIRQIASELRVRYVVEGSVRRWGDRIRVNIQLIDGESEEHVWAKRYDFSSEELFSTQEDISRKISAQLSVPLIQAESQRAARLPAEDIDAWLLTQRAILTYYFAGPEQSTAMESMELLRDALEREPDYPYALAFHAHMCTTTVALGFSDDLERDTKLAFSQIEKALHLAPGDPMVLWCAGVVQGFLGDLDTAILTLQRAVNRNPNDAHALADLGAFLARAGRIDEARAHLQSAFSLSPNEPRAYIWHFYRGSLEFFSDVESALGEFEKSISFYGKYVPSWIGRIAALGFLGRLEDARLAADQFKKIYTDTSAERIGHLLRMGPIQDEALQQKIFAVLTEAGLGAP